MERSIAELVAAIHVSPCRVALAITGGGSRAIAELLEVPGGSRTLLEAAVPYAFEALVEYLGAPPEQACASRTARAMAMSAFDRARRLVADGAPLAGVGCTASLASDRPKRGPHRIHVAMQTARVTSSWSIELKKDARTRVEEEGIAARLLLNAIAEASEIEARCALQLQSGEEILHESCEAAPLWTDLLLGHCRAIRARGDEAMPVEPVLFPGAFNPLHAGHERMFAMAQQLLAQQVALEIAIANVDKPGLDFIEITERLKGTGQYPVWLTRAPTFAEKSALFPGVTFVVGADTIVRIAAPKYYGNHADEASAAIATIASNNCHFLVFGREIAGRFETLSTLQLPPALRALCQEVSRELFQEHVSSTELRQKREAGDLDDG